MTREEATFERIELTKEEEELFKWYKKCPKCHCYTDKEDHECDWLMVMLVEFYKLNHKDDK